MTKGVLLIAHDNGLIDYAALAILSASLAKKYLSVPVSVIADQETVDSIHAKIGLENNIFDKIITVEKPSMINPRVIFHDNEYKTMAFVNQDRSSAWQLTPYKRTLLIDADFLILSNRLGKYWDYECDFLIAQEATDILGTRMGLGDTRISDIGPILCWATTVMFTKNSRTEAIFDLINFIKDNYFYYSELYRFPIKTYRNDIAFSIAKHIIDGFCTLPNSGLPPVLTMMDKDVLCKIKDRSLKFIIDDNTNGNLLVDISDRDIHFINKKTILDNYESLMDLTK